MEICMYTSCMYVILLKKGLKESQSIEELRGQQASEEDKGRLMVLAKWLSGDKRPQHAKFDFAASELKLGVLIILSCVFSQSGCKNLRKEYGEVWLSDEEDIRKMLIKLKEEGKVKN
uniref:Uncharacterized protein n=1 Tax=Cucumis melo TaxID=3656 RepID=A0A9I9E9T6_CUCME